jgi:sporulation protein YqfC
LQKNIRDALAEISKEEFSDYLMPNITFNSCKTATVEGSRGVLEYKPDRVRISCGKYILKFIGDGLCIRSPDTDQVIISGKIVSFEFSDC